MSASTADLLADPGLAGEIAARSPMQLFMRRFREDRVAVAAAAFIVVLIAVAIFSPLIRSLAGAPDPNLQNPNALDVFGTPTGPSSAHWFGVDELGRDVFSRVLAGASVSLQVAFIATGIALVVGTSLGMIAGYYRGWADTVISRAVDVLLAFPILLLALGLAAACSGIDGCLGGLIQPGKWLVIFVIAFVNWTYVARLVRGQTLSLREKEFVEAARAMGSSDRRIVFSEILPNLVAPIIVYATLLIPTNILFEAALSFLGVGVQPPQASWGQMIADATSIFGSAPWFMLAPGIALVMTVLAFNLVGDGLQDALNPRSARS
ncbi:MAG TPA: ABC transporter permease [Solirubrobacteraceae bacterium]|nr:ABC transporter permease [Solirubrobacteraceae bacterium]